MKIKIILFLMLGLIDPNIAHGATITEEQAVRCLIGEAANQGIIGMTAVGEVMRRRGSTKGIYGCNAKHIAKEPQKVWVAARKAWRDSARTNLTRHATHWENTTAFGVPRWAGSMVKTVKIKDHVFYRQK